MPSYSEGNPYLVEVSSIGATPDTRMGTQGPHHTTTIPPADALVELAALLADPSVRAWALAPTGQDNGAVQVGSGQPDALARRANLASGDAVWAVVVRPSPDVLAIDLDGCAELVLPALLRAAEDTSTTVLACVASGRPDCAHLWLAPATRHGRDALCCAARTLAELHDLPTGAIDDRSGKTIRLPGSVSLKPGGQRAHLIDPETGDPVDSTDVLALARATLPRPSVRRTPKPRRKPIPPAPLPIEVDTSTQLVTDAPRAWRHRTPFTTEEWAVLTDTRTRDRSAAATAAAWVLWRHGIRSGSAALWWYQRVEAFDKFRHRDDNSRSDGATGEWSACRRHWNSIAARARTYRPDAPADDLQVIARARTAVAHWTDADLHAAALVVIDRIDDGYGITNRPIARRDLQLALHLSDGVASARLASLVQAGLLVVTTPWSASAPREATRFTLRVPSTCQGDSAHDVTSPALALRHCLWGSLGHAARRTWLLLRTTPAPLPTRTLAGLLRLPVGDRSHGTLRLLHALADAGLAHPQGHGRGRRWTLAPGASLDAAAEHTGAHLRARELAARIHAERGCWHAESHSESRRSHRGLLSLRRRLHHPDALGRTPGRQPAGSGARPARAHHAARPRPGRSHARLRSRAPLTSTAGPPGPSDPAGLPAPRYAAG